MSTPPIKTGAWLYMKMYNRYHRCDLYHYADKVLIARVNPNAVFDPPPDEGIWATMYDFENSFADDGVITYVSTEYDIHYMLQFSNGAWHDVKLA